ncbi:MAG: 5-(carboxyamino)imidazole ribonucleotide synthase [Microcystaceae cyanobacterium]
MVKQRIGVIGGGQLAWMMAQESQKLGLEIIVQTPSPDDPAVGLADGGIFAAIDDAIATEQLAQQSDVITFENEFVNLESLQKLADQGVCFRPRLEVLAALLDKYQQRCYLQKLGLSVPHFEIYNAHENLIFAYPFVLKARRYGYDGQGTHIIRRAEDLANLGEKLTQIDWMIEEFIPFQRELAIMAARNQAGEIVLYPIVETYQEQAVCRWVKVPALISLELQQKINNDVKYLLTKLQVVGIFGIEFFLTLDQQILINEIAPRTHNSGHYTLDACETSQFAMQLQAVADLPLGSPSLKASQALMVNLLGYEIAESDYQLQREKLANLPNTFVHWYGKSSSRPGRKLGHVTVLLNCDRPTQSDFLPIIEEINQIWYGNSAE